MFVAMDKITNSESAEAAKVIKTPDTALPKPLAEHNIKLYNHVIFYDKYNKLFRGTAKWIGTYKSNDTTVVGIEVVSNGY